MASQKSFDKALEFTIPPSAILSDGGALLVPLYVVTAMSLNESYHLPSIGTSGSRAIVSTHDDTISLNGLLVGTMRFLGKAVLELMAETGRRGSGLEALPGTLNAITGGALSLPSGRVSGLILITSMTIRTDIQIQSLSFSASASRRDVLEVSISMVHLPKPGGFHKLLDAGAVLVSSLRDWA